jgi:predicted nucleic acid-binding protein
MIIAAHERAMGISRRYGLSIWDGHVVADAAEAGCTRLLTEDLQFGQVADGVLIENPFLATMTP